MQTRIIPNLWFDTDAEEAALFYTSIFEDSRIVGISRYPDSDADPAAAERAMQAMLGMRKLDIAELARAADGQASHPQAA